MSALVDLAPVAASQTPPRSAVDEIALLRKQGVYCLAGVIAAIAAMGGYLYLHESAAKPTPPPADEFVLYQNDKKETIRLNKLSGNYTLIKDGVEVSRVFRGEYENLLRPKTYAWGAWAEGGKVNLKLMYDANTVAICKIEVEDMPLVCQQKIANPQLGQWLYRVEFQSTDGIALETVTFQASLFTQCRKDAKLIHEANQPFVLSPATYLKIERAQIWPASYPPQQSGGNAK